MSVTKVKCTVDSNSIKTAINKGSTIKKKDFIFEFKLEDALNADDSSNSGHDVKMPDINKYINKYIKKRINDYINECRSAMIIDKYNVLILTKWSPIGNAQAIQEKGLIKVKITGELSRQILDEKSFI